MLKVEVHAKDCIGAEVDVLMVGVFDGKVGSSATEKALNKALEGSLEQAVNDEKFKGKAGQSLVMHTQGKLGAKRVALLGLGSEKSINTEGWLAAGGAAARLGNKVGAQKALLCLPKLGDDAIQVAKVLTRGAYLGVYKFDEYLSENDNEESLTSLGICGEDAKKRKKSFEKAVTRAELTAAGVCLARDLVNLPGNDLRPTDFAQRANEVAKACQLKIKVFEAEELQKKNMNLLLGVGQGSENKSRLVHLRYEPKGAKKAKPVVFVGKGITFDSGGLSLKPPGAMYGMKMDMGGAASVLGLMSVVGKIKPRFPVHGVLALAENMPSGEAIRPGDVITGAAGKSVEINNTDAEGRLVLADALNYALSLEPKRIVDLATLTGACMVALGGYTVGLFSNNDKVAEDILAGSKKAGEDFWRMPLTGALKEQLKSDVADLKNTGERFGGAITAGLFLQEFVEETPWAHLDIAGPAFTSKDSGAYRKGGTGVAVATLLEMLGC
ncbi:MAG: leucyl aminopeptidase [Myxococcota bacterium]|nr:leucyl aminopeptidase [Myxococcota bacterium]